MAYLFRNNTSPFWWLRWKNPATGKAERLSTKFRIGSAREHSSAVQLRNQFAVKETASGKGNPNPFAAWVNSYLIAAHSNVPRTLTRYQSTWKLLSVYLHSKQIYAPAHVTREICLDYLAWRKAVPHLNGKKAVSQNTIILELKLLGKILGEAVARGYIQYNPCYRLKLKKAPQRSRDELTDEQINIIEAAINQRRAQAKTAEEKFNAEFRYRSFLIARFQGIRLNETRLRLDDVDLERQTTFVMGKGSKLEEINLNPELIPFLKEWKAAGHEFAYEAPRMPSLVWFKFWKRLRKKHPGFKRISFHSTRVTVVSRMERAGVPENVMMKAVLHSSTTVHRVYRKVQRSELAPFWHSLDVKDKRHSDGNPDAAQPNPKGIEP